MSTQDPDVPTTDPRPLAGLRRPRSRAGRRASATLRDVAIRANVSEVTVSRIIRNKGYIAPETRQRVLSAIREVGYRPNRIAGTLATASTSNLIGVIIPSLSNIVFAEVLDGVQNACGTVGLQPVVGVTDYNPEIEERVVDSILAWRPTALLIAGFDHTEPARQQLELSGVRVAELMDIDARPIDVAVGLSHHAAGLDTARHLVRHGYRRFGYVGHDWVADRRARRRYDGLCAGLGEAGLGVKAQVLFDGPSSVGAGKAMLGELIAQHSDLDVVVFSNDDMAVGGVFHCLAAGLPLKTGLAVFGFNGLDIGQSLPIPLSTIRSNRFEIGRLAVNKVVEQAERPADRVVVDAGYGIIEGGTA